MKKLIESCRFFQESTKMSSSSSLSASEPEPPPTFDVYLHVYDVTPKNWLLWPLRLGFYYTGVAVHGIEYTYSGRHGDQVNEGEPGRSWSDGFVKHREGPILVGRTKRSLVQTKELIHGLVRLGIARNVHPNHFSDVACRGLTGNRPIPRWINRTEYVDGCWEWIIPAEVFDVDKRKEAWEKARC